MLVKLVAENKNVSQEESRKEQKVKSRFPNERIERRFNVMKLVKATGGLDFQ